MNSKDDPTPPPGSPGKSGDHAHNPQPSDPQPSALQPSAFSLQPPQISLVRGNRPARILLCDDEPTVRDCLRIFFEWTCKDYEVVECDTGHATLREIARQTPDLLITDCCHVGLSFPDTIPILFNMQVRFPILVASGALSPEVRDHLLSFPTFDIALLDKPFTIHQFRNTVLRFLGPKPDPQPSTPVPGRKDIQPSALSLQPSPLSLARPNRSARIVLLDDEPGARDLVRTMLPLWFRDYLLIECTTGDEAWREITRRAPDLLITDYGHSGYSVEELLHRFYRSRSKFPILLSSLYVGACPELQQRLLSFPGYTIQLLNKPFALPDLKLQVLKSLNPEPSRGN